MARRNFGHPIPILAPLTKNVDYLRKLLSSHAVTLRRVPGLSSQNFIYVFSVLFYHWQAWPDNFTVFRTSLKVELGSFMKEVIRKLNGNVASRSPKLCCLSVHKSLSFMQSTKWRRRIFETPSQDRLREDWKKICAAFRNDEICRAPPREFPRLSHHSAPPPPSPILPSALPRPVRFLKETLSAELLFCFVYPPNQPPPPAGGKSSPVGNLRRTRVPPAATNSIFFRFTFFVSEVGVPILHANGSRIKRRNTRKCVGVVFL